MLLSLVYQSRSRIVKRWILPSLVARILVPLGFMPGNVFAGNFLLPCPSAMPASVFLLDSETVGQGKASREHHGHLGHAHHSANATDTGSDNDADLVGIERQCPVGLALSADIHSSSEPDLPEPSSALVRVTGESSERTSERVFPRYQPRAPPISAG